ncbi:MAG TPA: hypothetical protein DEF25_09790 [Thermoanaerobacter sp.]|jgi:hypothetical protein|nr:hypothetical protein [Thermoanaerobacter sp.]
MRQEGVYRALLDEKEALAAQAAFYIFAVFETFKKDFTHFNYTRQKGGSLYSFYCIFFFNVFAIILQVVNMSIPIQEIFLKNS